MIKTSLLSILLLSTVLEAEARPAQIVLLRHAEKPLSDADIHLSERGKQRADALADFLTKNPALTAHGAPCALFAAQPTHRDHGWRAFETLEPLAHRLRCRIQTPFAAKDYAALAKRILNDRACDGKTVIVCWVHSELPQLAKALGVTPKVSHWKTSQFDRIWLINYTENGSSLTDLPQHLLPGDAAE